jgi:ubiquinone/menaquinone biosynthesis C-methylase UbiE
MNKKRGLQLERVVLLGRTFEEYCGYFALDSKLLHGKTVLDVAGGVGSFSAEAHQRGIDVTAFDPIYALTPQEIEARCGPDLHHVLDAVQGLSTYVWKSYRNPEHLRELREKAYRTFLADFAKEKGRHYIAGSLPKLPFDSNQFDLCFVSYFLFVYEDQFDYEFHRASIREIMRVTKSEARIYPIVTFEAEKSSYIEKLQRDPTLNHLKFQIVRTDFEFLVNSNYFLRISHANS